ncbi:type II toxin-antitoxin system HicB family antitoxin [Thioflexithrix psekupsensis]|uniref:Antitoxin HicB n=1 Tax=Thioflexithrix psekupsensis TaxID=1570016 RepID=A0A251X8C3_9GAMM|nr:type II toxin-antitoxin system HicB family antitoxin [Thioflexithrix psekupsensis]OUD14221.1 antitoxin HicB [Thioflexithrix psekupsensis]
MLEYKGYIGKVEFDDDAEILHGMVVNTRAVITFQAESVAEIKKAFKDSVDDYLDFCQELGNEPEKPFSGKLVLRLSPEQHRYASLAAKVRKKSLNQWISDLVEDGIRQDLPYLYAPSEKEIAAVQKEEDFVAC